MALVLLVSVNRNAAVRVTTLPNKHHPLVVTATSLTHARGTFVASGNA